MKIVDTNVLLNAFDSRASQHAAARRWLDHALSGGTPVGFAWVAVLGFIRIATNPRLSMIPPTLDSVLAQVEAWLTARTAHVVHPGSTHLHHVAALLSGAGAAGNLTTDAHLAALALEHRATVVTFDSDFGRFPGVKWESPR